MKIVTFASTKGGVGKSTLAFALAIEAARRGKTAYLADMDPQQTLMHLAAFRAEHRHGTDGNPLLLENVGSVRLAAIRLRGSDYERDYMFVDTPSSLMEVVNDAIGAADCVVVPCLASPLDILSQEEILHVVSVLGKTPVTLFALNRADMRARLTAEVMKKIEPLLPNKPATVAYRTSYAEASIEGLSSAEIDANAQKEIAALFDAVMKVLRKGGKYEKTKPRSQQAQKPKESRRAKGRRKRSAGKR